MDKQTELFKLIKNIIELQDKQRETLKKLVIAVLAKQIKPCTLYEWEEALEKALYEAGLGPKPAKLVVWEMQKRRRRVESA